MDSPPALKTCHRHVFYPSFAGVGLFESLLEAKKKSTPLGWISFWRRVRDSNPRFLSESLVFKTSSLNRSDNSPEGSILSFLFRLVKQLRRVLILYPMHRMFHTLFMRWYLWNRQPIRSHYGVRFFLYPNSPMIIMESASIALHWKYPDFPVLWIYYQSLQRNPWLWNWIPLPEIC